ncbi:hypothetical protein CLM83_04685 [Streptomyces albidoflavus]|nr:hypothetical protein CLM83_04685 [Streptomyces albidoflavus]
MYTSGSTGRPKGVAITHADITALAADTRWHNGAHRPLLFHSPHSFDAPTYQIWAPLLPGHLLTVPDRAAVGTFAATTCRLGIRLDPHDHWRVYAPHGLAGIFTLVLRPNPVLAPREVYEAKAERWQRQWPELRVLGRPETD